jgi:hypothetical protein
MLRKFLFISIVTFASFFLVSQYTGQVFACKDCYCTTVTLEDGSKSCELNADSGCSEGLVPFCQFNPDGACNHNMTDGQSCVCKEPGWVPSTREDSFFCTQQGHGADSLHPQINTALGCIPVEMGPFVQWLLPKFFSIAGGIAFLLMIYGFILISTSGGDPKKVEGARETITSAITGLLFSIFSLFILRLIAVDILHIPGISK